MQNLGKIIIEFRNRPRNEANGPQPIPIINSKSTKRKNKEKMEPPKSKKTRKFLDMINTELGLTLVWRKFFRLKHSRTGPKSKISKKRKLVLKISKPKFIKIR